MQDTRDDEEAAGIGGGGTEGEEGEVLLCVKIQLFTILLKYWSLFLASNWMLMACC